MSKEHGLTLTETELSEIVCVVHKMDKTVKPLKPINIKVPAMLVFAWCAGVVLSSGFWSTFWSIFFPPWAWYLVAEKIVSYLP